MHPTHDILSISVFSSSHAPGPTLYRAWCFDRLLPGSSSLCSFSTLMPPAWTLHRVLILIFISTNLSKCVSNLKCIRTLHSIYISGPFWPFILFQNHYVLCRPFPNRNTHVLLDYNRIFEKLGTKFRSWHSFEPLVRLCEELPLSQLGRLNPFCCHSNTFRCYNDLGWIFFVWNSDELCNLSRFMIFLLMYRRFGRQYCWLWTFCCF